MMAGVVGGDCRDKMADIFASVWYYTLVSNVIVLRLGLAKC